MPIISSSWLSRFARGLFSKDHSFATGVLLALLVWTLTRLVDGFGAAATVEYEISATPVKLASGAAGHKVHVVLSNISRDASQQDIAISISDPEGMIKFSDLPRDRYCAYPEPSWAKEGSCESSTDGLEVKVPWLVAGTSFRAGIAYTGSNAKSTRPVVRIKPGNDGKIALVEAGPATTLARHETLLLIALLLLTGAVLCLSVAAGIAKPDEGHDNLQDNPGGKT